MVEIELLHVLDIMPRRSRAILFRIVYVRVRCENLCIIFFHVLYIRLVEILICYESVVIIMCALVISDRAFCTFGQLAKRQI